MKKNEILDSLKNFSSRFPKEAIKEIQANRGEFIPELLEALDYACQNAKELYERNDKDNDYFLHTYAMFLLAEFREKKAFPRLVAFLNLPEDYVDFLLGDTLTEDFKRILLSTYDGKNMQMLFDVIEDWELCKWSRNAALDAYALLHMEGYVSQDDFIAYLRSLIYEKLVDDESEMIHTSIVGCIIDTHTVQMIPDALFLYDNNKVYTRMHGKYDGFLDWMFYDKKYEEKSRYIDDTVESMEWWAAFDEGRAKDEPNPRGDIWDKFVEKGTDGIKKDREQEQRFLSQKKQKPGRNDPCPCGSGKKYKKCCLDKDNNAVTVSNSSVAPIEEKYDLFEMYPKDSPLFKELYEKEAVEVDMLVYKALHHRAIPIWVKRDLGQERLGKINYLNEALKLFLDKCEREQITSFAAYDDLYMVHYRSSEWVGELIDLTKDDALSKITDIRKQALETYERFDKQ